MIDQWICGILEERFGHRFTLFMGERLTSIRLPGSEREIRFEPRMTLRGSDPASMPCGLWDASAEGWRPALPDPMPTPGLQVPPSPLIISTAGGLVVRYDLLDLASWVLSRYEEIQCRVRDPHGRFPAKASHAFRHGYLARPIVDEWLHVLGQVIQRCWPDVELKRHRFQTIVSHDVDIPARYAFRSPKNLLVGMASDVFRHGAFASAVCAPLVRWRSSQRIHPYDSANTFDWIMDQSERHGLKSAFYFLSGRTNIALDGDYELEHPAIRNLLRRIHERGHEIGLHPSYETYRSGEHICVEARRLRRVCFEERIQQGVWGGRMHYLRWEHPTTMLGWESAGMTYDSTLGYADHPGFRCGTCFDYPGFDPVAGRILRLRLRPLIAMERTLIDERYLGLGASESALLEFVRLKEVCRSVAGVFTLLWHNSELATKECRDLYLQVLSA